MVLSWRFIGKWLSSPQRWYAHRPYTLDQSEYAVNHQLEPVTVGVAALPVFAYIHSDTRVHVQFKCLCGEPLTLHREGESRDAAVTYHEKCRSCKRRWSLLVEPTLPKFDMTLSVGAP